MVSHVQIFGVSWTVAHQAPLSMEFSKQEYWNYSKGSSQARDQTCISPVSWIGRRFPLPLAPPRKPWAACTHFISELCCFSCVRLCTTPWMTAHQSPLSLGFSKQERWSGLPFSSTMHESEKSEVAQLCPTLSDPMDCSLPDSSVHGIFQARVLEWVLEL